MHSTQAVLTSVRVVCDVLGRHIRVTEVTRVKSSKVGTILPCNCHAKLHVIVCTVVSVHSEVHVQIASSKWVWGTRNGPPRTQ